LHNDFDLEESMQYWANWTNE